jgi:predicted metal-dependent HD superfamily phosphohydrolase
MPQAVPELRQSWLRAWSGIGAHANGEEVYAALIARYSEPHRRYHTLQHLSECLALFELVQGLAVHPGEVETALWFHDAIYDVGRADNEERSAEWARTVANQAGVSRDVAECIHSLVMVTRHTGVPAGADEQLLVDIDLAILGADPQRFAQYERQIREEYANVPGEQFRQRRRAILGSFLDRRRVYSTAHFHDRLEAAARANLRAAIDAC